MQQAIKKLTTGLEKIVKAVFFAAEKILQLLDGILNLNAKNTFRFLLKKKILLAAVLLVVFAAFPLHPILAQDVGGFLTTALMWLFKTIINLLSWIIAAVLAPLFQAALSVNQSIFTSDGGVIDYGWKLLRDTANMFFILVLLAVAFGTILQLEAWNFKSVLPRFIVAIMLVNFSQVLTKTVIVVGNYLFIGILNAAGGAEGASVMFAKIVNLDSLRNINDQHTDAGLINTAVNISAAGLFTIVVLAVIASVIFRLSLTFFVRVVALWLLVMVSPFALLAMAIPSTKAYGKKWVEQLVKYIFIGPIAVFFYMLAVRIGLKPFVFNGVNKTAFDGLQGLTNLTDIRILVPLIFVLILLWLAGSIAKKGAGMVGEAAYGMGKKWGGKAFAFGAGLGLGALGGSGRLAMGRWGGKDTNVFSRTLAKGFGYATNMPTTLKTYSDQWKAGAEGRKKDFAKQVKGGWVGSTLKRMQPEAVQRDAEIANLNEMRKRWYDAEGVPLDHKAASDRVIKLMKEGGDKNDIRMGMFAIEKEGHGKALQKRLQEAEIIGANDNLHDALNKMYGGKDTDDAKKYGRQLESLAKATGDFGNQGEFNYYTGKRTTYDEANEGVDKRKARGDVATNQALSGKKADVVSINVDTITIQDKDGNATGFTEEGGNFVEGAIKKGFYTPRALENIPQYAHDQINLAAAAPRDKGGHGWKPVVPGQNYLEWRMAEREREIKKAEKRAGREGEVIEPVTGLEGNEWKNPKEKDSGESVG